MLFPPPKVSSKSIVMPAVLSFYVALSKIVGKRAKLVKQPCDINFEIIENYKLKKRRVVLVRKITIIIIASCSCSPGTFYMYVLVLVLSPANQQNRYTVRYNFRWSFEWNLTCVDNRISIRRKVLKKFHTQCLCKFMYYTNMLLNGSLLLRRIANRSAVRRRFVFWRKSYHILTRSN